MTMANRTDDAEQARPERPIEDAKGRILVWPNREAQQRALERRMRGISQARGAARLARAEERGAESETGHGARAVAEGLDLLAGAIRAEQAASGRRKGPKPEALKRIASLEPETAAYLTLRGLMDQLSKQPKLSTLSVRVGAALEDEIRAREAETLARSAEDQALLREIDQALAAPRGRRRKLTRALKKAGAPLWGARERQLTGLWLLNLALETLDLAEVVETPTPGEPQKLVRRLAPSAKSVAARERAQAAAERIAPLYEPMVVPPLRWRDAWSGGYLTPAVRPPLVKTRESEALERLTREGAPIVFAAVDAAQETAWRVNRRILNAMRAIDADPALAAQAPIPSRQPDPSPCAEEPPAARQAWATAERRRRSRRLAYDRALAQAERHSRLPAFYFPYQLDFRGRLYAVTEFSPQGPDPMKALLRFARAEPLGEEGWKWLAIHLCNCGDFERMSKAPLTARVEWTLANEERILTVAADPLADLWWTEADQPWQFLAACFEWEGFCRDGEAFRSALPVALDGSCSGIQHFSLALRDEIGGAAVNLGAHGPEAKAADIYAKVAETVKTLLRADLDSAETLLVGKDEEGAPRRRAVADMARAWLEFGVDRGVCKRPTMTYGYGARGYGYVEQILEDTLAPAFAAHKTDPSAPWPFEGRGFAEALYLAARMTEAIERTVLKAAEAMRWLQRIADQAAADGRPLCWTTPDGFPVRQAYRERLDRRVKTRLAGRPVRLALREETEKLDARRQRQGVAPNYVHALDACHLRLTLARAAEEGLRDFAIVHDSFGAHAARTPRFFQIIREAMVEMYEQVDVMGVFRDEIAGQLSPQAAQTLAEPPVQGRLQLDAVLNSDHCFS